jgi:hypothetical protein
VQRTDCGERQTEILILVLLQVSVWLWANYSPAFVASWDLK